MLALITFSFPGYGCTSVSIRFATRLTSTFDTEVDSFGRVGMCFYGDGHRRSQFIRRHATVECSATNHSTCLNYAD